MKEFGSEFNIGVLPNDYFDNLYNSFSSSHLLRSGREAIYLAARSIDKCSRSNATVALLPAYCCWSMEFPFSSAGYQIEYYKLNADLTIDKEFLDYQISAHHPSCILLVNYYGFTPTKNIASHIKNNYPTVYTIEDFSQNLFALEIDNNIDIYVASIRKSVGVPDGGIILSNTPCTEEIKEYDTHFVEHRLQAEILKSQYQYSNEQASKDKLRNLLSQSVDWLNNNFAPYKMSDISRNIINHLDIKTICFARQFNYSHLFELLKGNHNIEIIFEPTADNKSPFAMPILINERDKAQQTLAQAGVFAPLLWPITNKAAHVCPVSKRMTENMLALPIDQRYDYFDIEEMGRRINQVM